MFIVITIYESWSENPLCILDTRIDLEIPKVNQFLRIKGRIKRIKAVKIIDAYCGYIYVE